MKGINEGFAMAEVMVGELKEIKKQLRIANAIELCKLRHDIKESTENGVEMGDEEFFKTLEDLWKEV